MDTNGSASPVGPPRHHSNATDSNANAGDERERHGSDSPVSARHEVNKAAIVAGLAVLSAGGFLLKDDALSKACKAVIQDANLHTICLDAAKSVGREVVASWQRNGGPAALAGALFR